MGKTSKDLPVLAIDSFQQFLTSFLINLIFKYFSMFLFEQMDELHVPGKLRQFIMDLHSGGNRSIYQTN
jgi:hypothetical protein